MSEETLRQIIELQESLIELLQDQVCQHFDYRKQDDVEFEKSLWTQLSELKDKMNKND